ncbi:MAG TPA: BrnT family toxin [Candidatus Acidoferrales bacterium]|nr:BrnT family toxin [Candidatus Acidoferrales bacterium]
MKFEYDREKSAQNKGKHGIDFEEAQFLWADPMLVEIPARTSDEPRWMLIGKIGGKHWSAVITRRVETIRLISVRRSRPEEVTIYENEDVESDIEGQDI